MLGASTVARASVVCVGAHRGLRSRLRRACAAASTSGRPPAVPLPLSTAFSTRYSLLRTTVSCCQRRRTLRQLLGFKAGVRVRGLRVRIRGLARVSAVNPG
eukprot:1532610-Rhodomonas_salina.1